VDEDFDPLVPRPLDRPTAVPLDPDADLAVLDGAKIFAAPDDPADWPRWRTQLIRWREEARGRLAYDDALYRREDLAWTRSAFVVAQIWLWDELLYDYSTGAFTPERLLADAEERFGGFDGIVLWHAYPVIGIDSRNQWDYYREVPGLRALVDALHAAGVRVFVDYNPWDTGTRRGGSDAEELSAVVRDLDADGVFLDTLKEGGAGLLSRLEAVRPGVAVEGESTLPLARLADHPLSWAQWFADSAVPGVVRAKWYEPRHQLHHVRRWHRDHRAELQSAWLNGIGVMVWEVVFSAWVGWNAADAGWLRRMAAVQRAHADLLSTGTWTPLVDLGAEAAAAGVHGSLFAAGDRALLALVNRGAKPFAVSWRGAEVTVPGRGLGGLVANGNSVLPAWADELEPASTAFPHRRARRCALSLSKGGPSTGSGRMIEHVVVPAGEHVLTVRYRARETGMYEGAPFVDEWKPLPPRLHDLRTLERVVTLDHPVAVATVEENVTGLDLAEARAYAAARGARLPTEDEWQLAAAMPGFGRRRPLVWNLTESEHSDGRSRFCFLRGGADGGAVGSPWYFDSGEQPPEFSAKYLIPGGGLARSTSIGFRLAWDLT
jgi:sulfatase-modifying factor enzyme 1